MSKIQFIRLPYTYATGQLYLVNIQSKRSIGTEIIELPEVKGGRTTGDIWKFIKDYIELSFPHSLDDEEHVYMPCGVQYKPYGKVPFDEEGNVSGNLTDLEEENEYNI